MKTKTLKVFEDANQTPLYSDNADTGNGDKSRSNQISGGSPTARRKRQKGAKVGIGMEIAVWQVQAADGLPILSCTSKQINGLDH